MHPTPQPPWRGSWTRRRNRRRVLRHAKRRQLRWNLPIWETWDGEQWSLLWHTVGLIALVSMLAGVITALPDAPTKPQAFVAPSRHSIVKGGVTAAPYSEVPR